MVEKSPFESFLSSVFNKLFNPPVRDILESIVNEAFKIAAYIKRLTVLFHEFQTAFRLILSDELAKRAISGNTNRTLARDTF
ncbi:hypothetical protein BGZ93_000664 [Podila epicladia]|nr:hypothetical protein BGZ93_000664 [Podila epicladia]KAG0088264.1 hypothetical protein BGZ92_006443 [Podila epicladia]